jgi:WD40-like Beta Propeller Repeat
MRHHFCPTSRSGKCITTVFLLVGWFLPVSCGDGTGPATAPTGSARVIVTTSGPGVDTTSQYSVSVDGGTGRFIASNGSMTIDGLTAGNHRVALAAIPRNCTADQNPRTVTISANATATVSFAVSCVTPTGYLGINAVTTGADLDPDGYAMSIDNQATHSLGVNAAVVIANLAVGSHSVALSGVAGNCTVAGPNPAPATVGNGDTTRITFSITCVAAGALRVTAVTTGVDLDPNGYTISVDGQQVGAVASNAVATASPLAAGTRNVSLGDISSNCAVTGTNPQSVMIPVHDTARVTFQVSCVPAQKIAFVAIDGGGGAVLAVMLPDGSGEAILTQGPNDYEPAWAPDRTKIAFTKYDCVNAFCAEVWVVNADGTGATKLGVGRTPAWKPDGSQIAFYSHRDGADGLYVMNSDGSGVSKVISGIGGLDSPTWSPDGAKIAFNCQIDSGNADICTINADGTGLVRLTSDPAADYAPAWKPDGSKILFVTTRYSAGVGGLALMNPDGTGVASLITGGAVGAISLDHPVWSPTGFQVAFHEQAEDCGPYVSSGCYNFDQIAVANADGTGTTGIALGLEPAWRP